MTSLFTIPSGKEHEHPYHDYKRGERKRKEASAMEIRICRSVWMLGSDISSSWWVFLEIQNQKSTLPCSAIHHQRSLIFFESIFIKEKKTTSGGSWYLPRSRHPSKINSATHPHTHLMKAPLWIILIHTNMGGKGPQLKIRTNFLSFQSPPIFQSC